MTVFFQSGYQSLPHSKYITTPDQYESFKNEANTPSDVSICIESTAHPNILSEVNHFLNSNAAEIRFIDVRGNKISILPKIKKAIGSFYSGGNNLLKMPTSYRQYDVRIDGSAMATQADINAILQWKSAEKILLIDQGDILFKLMLRVDELSNLHNLEELTLKIHQQSFESLYLHDFLYKLHGLKKIEFVADSSMTEYELNEFVAQQNVSNWSFETEVLPDRVIFRSVDHLNRKRMYPLPKPVPIDIV